MTRFTTAEQDLLMDWTRLRKQGAAKHLPLQAFEVAEFKRRAGWWVRELLSVVAVFGSLAVGVLIIAGLVL